MLDSEEDRNALAILVKDNKLKKTHETEKRIVANLDIAELPLCDLPLRN